MALIFSDAGVPLMVEAGPGLRYETVVPNVGAIDMLCRCASDILSALEYLHCDAGIVHRDVKPDNILYSNGMFTLSDFGSARVCPAGRLRESPATVGFFPPEICSVDAPNEHSGFKADLWAMGLVLFACCTGALPYSISNTKDYVEVVDAIAAWSIQDDSLEEVPVQLHSLLQRLLNRSPEERLYLTS